MIARYRGTCRHCYRSIEQGEQVGYRRGQGISHPVCPAISTAELKAGRERYEQSQEGLLAAARRAVEPSYDRFDAANPTRATSRGGDGSPD